MGRKTIIIALALILISAAAFSQKKDSTKIRLNHYSFTFGTGWSHYFNNLENGDQDIKKDFMGFSLKFYWEPEHLVSLGLETGYYQMFRTNYELNPDTTGHVNRNVIPLLLLVRMRIIDHFYLGAGMGIAIIKTKVLGYEQKITTSTNSLSNFELSGSYVYPLNKHWIVGGEVKAFHFGKYNDWMLSIQATCAFRL